jgi:hypothetical protein
LEDLVILLVIKIEIDKASITSTKIKKIPPKPEIKEVREKIRSKIKKIVDRIPGPISVFITPLILCAHTRHMSLVILSEFTHKS